MKPLHIICSLSLFCYGTMYSDQSEELYKLLNEPSHEIIKNIENTTALHKLYNMLDNENHWKLYGIIEECRKMCEAISSIDARIKQPDQETEITQKLSDHKYDLEKRYQNYYAYTIYTFKEVISSHIENKKSKDVVDTCLGALQSIIKSTQKNSECVTQ